MMNMAGPCAPEAHGAVSVLPAIRLREHPATSDAVNHHGGHGPVTDVRRAGLPTVLLQLNRDQKLSPLRPCARRRVLPVPVPPRPPPPPCRKFLQRAR